MNYQQTLDFLYKQLPMFQRVGAPAYKSDLKNTIVLCKMLGNPEQKFPSIHIAGTNGKGSVAHLVASVLQEAGYKVGLYTSPHLTDFRERIRINGKKIPKEKVVQFVQSNKSLLEKIEPSFFEYTFGTAIRYFADENIDIAVMETGMGGRLDSTNVVNSIISVITNIGFDHTQFLGDTLGKIAIEKAGIIKPKIPVIIGETQEEIQSVFEEIAKINKSEIYFADKEYSLHHKNNKNPAVDEFKFDVLKKGEVFIEDLQTDLLGKYQLKNLVTTQKIIDLLQEHGFSISTSHIKQGFKNTCQNTGLAGRWQVLNKYPLTICDTGHNVDGIRGNIEQLAEITHERLHIVFGLVNDKNIEPILNVLPKNAIYYFCKANIPRGLDQLELKGMAHKNGMKGKAYKSVYQAYKAAKQNANTNDMIFIGGSTFVVAEIL
jgi:dihydrofolate synthase/folylpolyglutamate synthase